MLPLWQGLWGLNCMFCIHPSGRDLGDRARLQGGKAVRQLVCEAHTHSKHPGPALFQPETEGLVDAGAASHCVVLGGVLGWGHQAVGELQHLGAGLSSWFHRRIWPGLVGVGGEGQTLPPGGTSAGLASRAPEMQTARS